jgi:hypothetical protein
MHAELITMHEAPKPNDAEIFSTAVAKHVIAAVQPVMHAPRKGIAAVQSLMHAASSCNAAALNPIDANL